MNGKYLVVCDYGYDGYGFRGPFDSVVEAGKIADSDHNAVAVVYVQGIVAGKTITPSKE
jgi:hypothetical protein